MSKIRTVKPEFWSSEQVVRCSTNARLLFIGLWNFCDDAGIHPASPMRLKMEVFPGDVCTCDDIKNWINELINADLIHQYEIDGKTYWQVKGWYHQKIDRPNIKHPLPQQCSNDVNASHEQCSNAVATVSQPPSKGRECKGIDKRQVEQAQPASVSQDVMDIFTYWQTKLNHPKAKLDSKRKRKIESALKLYPLDDLKKAIDGCSMSKFHLGENDSGTKYDGLELILRDAEHIEKFMSMAKTTRPLSPLALDE